MPHSKKFLIAGWSLYLITILILLDLFLGLFLFITPQSIKSYLPIKSYSLLATFLAGTLFLLLGFKRKISRIVLIAVLIFLIAFLYMISEPISYDSRIQASMSSLRVQTELFWDKGKSYGNQSDSCDNKDSMFGDMQVTNLIKAAEKLSKHKAVCFSNPEAWAVSIELRNQREVYYCVDSTGFAGNAVGNIASPSCAVVKVGTN